MNDPASQIQPVAPGVGVVPVRSPTLPPATHTNVWLIGEHHVTVIDPASPYPDEQERLDEILEMVLVERIILTHHHADHVGGVMDLKARTGASIAAHALTRDRVDFEVDELLEDEQIIATDAGFWKVIHTPGHATGHICLHNPSIGTIVAGDMVAGVGTILLDPPEGNLGLYLDSLEQLKALKPTLLLPAHGPPIENAIECLDEYINHRHMRTQQIVDGLAAVGPATPIALVPAIYADLIPVHFHAIAARQVLCHLQWLVAQGTVIETDGQFTLAQT